MDKQRYSYDTSLSIILCLRKEMKGDVMTVYNIDLLKDEAEILPVVKYVGIKMKKIGKRYYIQCPKHEEELGKVDQNLGNCLLYRKRYRCFACGASENAIDMVMSYTGCSLPEALGIVGDALGGRERYILQGKINTTRPLLSTEELQAINLHPWKVSSPLIINGSLEKQDVDPGINIQQNKNEEGEEYLYYKTSPAMSIHILYEEDRELYKYIVKSKATEALQRAKITESFLNRESEMFQLINEIIKGPDGFLEEEDIFGIRNGLRKKQKTCKDIIDKIDSLK